MGHEAQFEGNSVLNAESTGDRTAPAEELTQRPLPSLMAVGSPRGTSSRSETSAEMRRLQSTVGTLQMQIEAQMHRRARADLELNSSLVTLQTRT